MKQTWRKLLTAFCAASMLMTLPGVSVYAADTDYESIVESIEAVRDETEMDGGFLEEGSVYEEPEFAAEVVESSDDISASTDIDEDPAEDAVFADAETPDPEEQEDSAETIDLPEEHSLLSEDVFEEESIGDYGYYVVGDGVAALYDSDTGSITLRASNNRTLWRDWLERAGIDRESVKSISVVQTASTNTASKVKLPADSSSVFSKLVNLTALDLKGFDTSNVENMGGLFYDCSKLTSIIIPNSVTSIGLNAFGGVDFSNIVSLVENPFVIMGKSSNARTFSENTYNNAILYVPKGTKEKYESTEGWKDFLYIEEGSPSSITNIESEDKKEYKRYTLDGRVVKNSCKGLISFN